MGKACNVPVSGTMSEVPQTFSAPVSINGTKCSMSISKHGIRWEQIDTSVMGMPVPSMFHVSGSLSLDIIKVRNLPGSPQFVLADYDQECTFEPPSRQDRTIWIGHISRWCRYHNPAFDFTAVSTEG